MVIVCITIPGAVRAAQAELTSLGFEAKSSGSDWVSGEASDATLGKLHLRAQTIIRILDCPLDRPVKLSEVEMTVKKLPAPRGTFALRASGDDRQELEETYGGQLKEQSGARVDLSKPDERYLLWNTDGGYLVGKDLYGELGKRHYKIVTGAQSLSGPTAASVLWLVGWQPKIDLVVWPCGTGELAIEAALYATGKSPRAYELEVLKEKATKTHILAADPRLPMVRIAEKNAKVAGVHHALTFSRQDAKWLDTKHDEHEVRFLIGILPNLVLQPKLIGELFFQLEYILKRGGIAAFICVNEPSAETIEQRAPTEGYSSSREYVWQGQQCLTIVKLVREKLQK